MSARKYLNETGLASLWAKIVNKINDLGALCVKKAGDTMSGRLTVKGDAGGSWVSSKDVDQAAIKVNGTATNGLRYDTIISNQCYNSGVITMGRITDQLCFGYVTKNQTGNHLYKFMNFEPANGDGKVTFGTSGVAKSYIDLNNGSYVGPWNGYTLDMGTNNATDTWVPVQTSDNKFQHRVLSASLNNKNVKDATNVHTLGYSSNDIPTTQYIAYWNGAYNSSGNSNLKYTSVGELKSAAAKDAINDTNYTSVNYGIDRNLAYSVTGAAITCSHSRTKHENWTNKFTLICPRNAGALGTLICNSGSSWAHFYISCSGSPSGWNNTYNGGISNMSGTYPTLAVTNTTIDGVAYSVATWTSRAGNMMWHAEYTISNIAAP